MNRLTDLWWTVYGYASWYVRRPWHVLFGHNDMCVAFLEEERAEAEVSEPLDAAGFPFALEHDCCDCGMRIP